jgi:ABC-type lipoprotein export system ATPase subunit
MIRLENVYQKYDKTWILSDISCQFENKSYLIMGDSGIGKTTLLNIIGKIIKPTHGKVETRNKIGFIFQNFNLLSDFTVKENIEIGMKIKKQSGSYENIVELTGIKDILYKYPHQISGGQKQRTAIARTLADGSDFILADEPTGSLDDTNAENIRDIFHIINKELKVGFIISSHDARWKASVDENFSIKAGKLC